MAKKTIQTKKQAFEAEVEEWARRTEEWARAQGCYRDEQSGEILGYFVVEQSSSKNPKPAWCDWSGQDRESWNDVVLKMLQMGIPISAESQRGHYIGLVGEQGAKIASGLNNTFTRVETAKRHLEAIVMSGDWREASVFLETRLRDDLKNVDILKFIEGLNALLSSVGIKYQLSFAQLLLSDQMRADEESSAANEQSA